MRGVMNFCTKRLAEVLNVMWIDDDGGDMSGRI